MPDDPTVGLAAPLAAAIQRVRDDREHGASWLAREAAGALAAAGTLAQLHSAARAFAAARPSMAALTNTAARIWSAAASTEADEEVRLHAAQTAAQRLLATWENAASAITAHAQALLSGTLYSHSRSGTVEQVLLALIHEAATPRRIILDESRPGGEGITAARALAAAGWQVALVPDTASELFIREAQAVVIGADSVRADSSVVNKVGSHPLALVARDAGIPFYVLCETLKIAPPDFPLVLEEMDPAELLPDPPAGITLHNIYFDQTPAPLITGIVTERGMLAPQDITRIAQEAGTALATLNADVP